MTEHPEDDPRAEEPRAEDRQAEPEDRQAEPEDRQAEPEDRQAEPEDQQAEPEDQQGPPGPPEAQAEEEGAETEAPEVPAEQPAVAEETPAETQAPDPPAPEPAVAQGAEPPELAAEPRDKPEIPGADLEPVIIPEEDEEFLDAEAQAAAEAEAEAAAARERREREEEEVRPIADAAIDLAAGARYTATGKRKSAVARVILKPGSGDYSINGRELDSFFPRQTLQRMIRQPLEAVGYHSRMDVVARMHGGGVSAQAGALRHGISRALIVADPHLRGELKRRGFLTRDPRVKERKKAGLKKARKRPQFSKR